MRKPNPADKNLSTLESHINPLARGRYCRAKREEMEKRYHQYLIEENNRLLKKLVKK